MNSTRLLTRLLAVAVAAAALAATATPATAAVPGDLDTSFGEDGFVFTQFDPSDLAVPSAAVVQPDGRIVAVGATTTQLGTDGAIARYLPDGRLDHSWDGDGRATLSIGHGDALTDVVLQPDGKIVVTGYTDNGNGDSRDFAVARYLPDGTLDSTFAGDGRKTIDFLAKDDQAYAVALDGASIVVAGAAEQDGPPGSSDDSQAAVARLTATGDLDWHFSGDGRQMVGTSSQAHSDVISDLVARDGKLVGAGTRGTLQDGQFAVYRFLADGEPDSSFSSDGVQHTSFNPPGTPEQVGQAVALQVLADGTIVAAGSTGGWPTGDIAAARYLPDGDLDPSFDGDGRVVVALSADYDGAASVLVRPGGKLLLAARAGTAPHLALLRLLPSGAPDPSFGGTGIRRHAGTAVYATVGAAVPYGKHALVTVGARQEGADPVAQFATTRFLIDPPPSKPAPPGSPPSGPTPGGPTPEAPRPVDPPLAGRCGNALRGTRKRDVLTGTPGGDRANALAGSDVLRGLAGADCLTGGAGRDRVDGGAGNDKLKGGAGTDSLNGGAGRNSYAAGAGNDRVNARNGVRETVNCGAGRDSVRADRSDRLRGCERVNRRSK
jgi:uncharacterized delta-60 repeat protein